jgi:uncharacterized protein (TIGR02145 family)
MFINNRIIPALLLASALCLALARLPGCAKKPGTEPGPETVDTLSEIRDTLSVTRDTTSETPDTLTDMRDGQKYRNVTIGRQTWMAQNLNYRTDSSWCYENSTDSCNKYGRLYNWNAAKKACPSGWHLSSNEEWDTLLEVVTGVSIDMMLHYGVIVEAVNELAAASWWRRKDTRGFSALPGGLRDDNGGFLYGGNGGIWWTATEDTAIGVYAWTATEDTAIGAYARNMGFYKNEILNGVIYKGIGYSVRCVKNVPPLKGSAP